MSLLHAAQHLKDQGRGPDDQLIHMSSNEIAGLQAIAEANGRTLTFNPETGLPEAGILDDLMPMIVGAGLAYATSGASLGAEIGLAGLSNQAIIGGGLGLLNYAKTGDIKDSLMTGLGAYGGAGLGAGLAATGAGPIPAYDAAKSGQVAPALTAPANVAAEGMTPGLNARDDLLMKGQSNLIGADLEQMPANIPTNSALTNPIAAETPGAMDFLKQNKMLLAMGVAPAVLEALNQKQSSPNTSQQQGTIRPYKFSYNPKTPQNQIGSAYVPGQDTSERVWFDPQYTALPTYKAASGGLLGLAAGGPVEQMSNANAVGANTGFPMSDVHSGAYATPYQTPISQNVLQGAQDTRVDPYTGEERFAAGGLSTLGGYAAGGNPRLLKGPGDGMSDNIPAVIGGKQPARLADGEFVVPADVVSHLGNGSTDAGAKQLYKMMDRIRQQRTGKKKQAPEVNTRKVMPA